MARSLEQIWNDTKTVSALRKECSRLGITRIVRDGMEIPTGTGRKDELLEAISRHESESETKPIEREQLTIAVQSKNPIVEEVPASVDETVIDREPITTTPTFKTETEYTDYEQLLKRLSSKYYQGFKSGDVEVVGVRQFAQSRMALRKHETPIK